MLLLPLHLLPLISASLPPPARRHRRPADQVQHLRQRHRQVGVHAAARGGSEGPHAALRPAAGPRRRPHHEEPGGTDAARPGNGGGDSSQRQQQQKINEECDAASKT